jgi:FAD/FMN-containing dehydrogenase
MDRPIDRRDFLLGAGAVGLALAGRTAAGRGARTAMRRWGPPIRGQVIRRGAPGFAEAAHVYNERFDGVLPALVARPLDAADVRTAVRWGVSHGVRLRARCGGHSYAGYSTQPGGVVLDLRRLRGVRVDQRNRTTTVGAGSQLIDVYAALAAHGLTVPAGSCPSVGVAGHALGGGMGLAARQWGLTADNLLEARIVTADGRLRTVNRRSDPNLYWALRGGGGGNFGVVTSFKFRVHEVPRTVAAFFVNWPWSRAADALAAWQAWAPHARSPPERRRRHDERQRERPIHRPGQRSPAAARAADSGGRGERLRGRPQLSPGAADLRELRNDRPGGVPYQGHPSRRHPPERELPGQV